MEIGRAGQPGKQRCVLDRVPGPVPAPAQHLVAPPRTEHDAEGEEAPRRHGPPSGLEQPALADSTRDERRDREGERNGESDVPGVEHRRMERDEQVILEQRVRTGADEISGDIDGHERVRRARHQGEEERSDAVEHDHRPAEQRIGAPVPELHHDGGDVDREHQGPQQDRTLQGGPDGREVEQRRRGVAPDLLDEGHGVVPLEQRHFHDRERTDTGQQQQPCPGPDLTDQACPSVDERVDADQAPHHRGDEPEHREPETERCVHRR